MGPVGKLSRSSKRVFLFGRGKRERKGAAQGKLPGDFRGGKGLVYGGSEVCRGSEGALTFVEFFSWGACRGGERKLAERPVPDE